MDTEKQTQDVHQQLNSMLMIEDIDSSASELHGLICARACLGQQLMHVRNWLPLLTGEPLAPATNKYFLEKLEQLTTEVAKTLEARNYELQLIVSNEGKVADQTESIAAWCQGFVLGLLGNGEQRIETLPENSREVVRDMMEISGASVDDTDEDDDQAARALAEIEEYVRMGVQVVYEDLCDDKS